MVSISISLLRPLAAWGKPLVTAAACLLVVGAAQADFQLEIPLPPEAPRPSVLDSAAEKVAQRGLKALDSGFRKVRAANLAEPYYEYTPLSKNAHAKQRLRSLAEELGIDPKRIVTTAGDAPMSAIAGGVSDFVFIHEHIVVNAPDDILAFLLAHEWGHLTREHGRKRWRLYYWEQVAACMSCVLAQQAQGVRESAIALNAQEGPIGQRWAVARRWQELEADLFAARLLKASGRRVRVDALFDYFTHELGGEREETLAHPSQEERKLVIRLENPDW